MAVAVYSADAVQTINPGEDAIFTTVVEKSNDRFIRHRPGTGTFLLSGWSHCRCKSVVDYSVDFGANIAIADGGTVGPISVAIALDGSTIPASEMIVTPAATEEYFNVSREIAADVWTGCCETVSVRNLSSQPILMQSATIKIER